MAPPTQLQAAEAVLLVIDVQEKLTAKIARATSLIRNIAFLLDVAPLVGVAVTATEQYPKGLGPTTPELARRLPSPLPDKTAFTCCAIPGLLDAHRQQGRRRVVLAGIETHVCVLHTALDLLADGFTVYLPVDAVASRFDIDHETALRRLEMAGAILTTSETCAFEWMGGAKHPAFKQVSALVQDRMKAME